jgi:hypothetical protein
VKYEPRRKKVSRLNRDFYDEMIAMKETYKLKFMK